MESKCRVLLLLLLILLLLLLATVLLLLLLWLQNGVTMSSVAVIVVEAVMRLLAMPLRVLCRRQSQLLALPRPPTHQSQTQLVCEALLAESLLADMLQSPAQT